MQKLSVFLTFVASCIASMLNTAASDERRSERVFIGPNGEIYSAEMFDRIPTHPILLPYDSRFPDMVAASPTHAGIIFHEIPLRTPLRSFVDDPKAFERSIGGELPGPLGKEQTELRNRFVRQLSNDRPFDRQKALFLAIGNNCISCVSLIAASGASLNDKLPMADEFTPLATAFSLDNDRMFQKLIDLGARIDTKSGKNMSLLYLAAGMGKLAKMNEFIGLGLDPHEARTDGITPFYFAAENGHLDILKRLTQLGVHPNQPNNSGTRPIHMAAQNNHTQIIRYLVQDLHIPVDEVGHEGNTPLHMAALNGRIGATVCLLNLGAQVNCQNRVGKHPLALAVQHARKKEADGGSQIRFLIEQGSDVSLTDDHDQTVFHNAAVSCNPVIVDALLHKKDDRQINKALKQVSSLSTWPLFLAAYIDNSDIFIKLLNAEPEALKIKTKNSQGSGPAYFTIFTALDKAKKNKSKMLDACAPHFAKEPTLFAELRKL